MRFSTFPLQNRKNVHVTQKVLGGFEPPSLDSESRVLTVTPQDQRYSHFMPTTRSAILPPEAKVGPVGVRTRGLLHAKQT